MFSEFKQYVNWKFFLLQIVILMTLFLASVGYVDDMGKQFSIFVLLFNRNCIDVIQNGEIGFVDLWSNGISTYLSFLYPLVVCLSYSFSVYYEKAGYRRYILIRKNRLKYCFDKITGLVIFAGLVFGIAYLLFGLLVVSRMFFIVPELSITGECFSWIPYSFVYGMEISLFFIVVSVFCKDKYELICFPILIKYFLLIISNRVLLIGIYSDKPVLIYIANVLLNPENVINYYSSVKEKIASMVTFMAIYCATVVLMNYRIKKDEKYGIV